MMRKVKGWIIKWVAGNVGTASLARVKAVAMIVVLIR